MFCTRCGAQNPEGATFCGTCGASLSTRDGASKPVADQPPSQSRPHPRRGLIVAAVAVAAALLAGGAAFGVWLAFFSPWPINDDNFPDPAVRAAVEEVCDKDGNGELSRDEARAVTELAVNGAEAFEGMGTYFPNLERLEFGGGELALLEVSDLPQLTSINAADEPLASLDVSSNHSLASLSVPDSTEVTGLDATLLHESWVITSVTEDYGNGYAVTYSVRRDAEGRVTARRNTDGDNDIRWEYEYDDEGRLVMEYEDSYFMGHQSNYTTAFTYDDEGRLSSMESYDGLNAYHYLYDEEGRLETIALGSVDYPTSTTSYTYDDDGALASQVTAYKSYAGTRDTFAYDEEGRLVEVVEASEEDGEVSQVTTYEYDDAGNLVRVDLSTRYDDEYGYSSYRAPVDFSYDGEGRMTEATATLDGNVYTATLTYDENGNLEQLVDGLEGGYRVVFTPSYTRYFVVEDGREPDSGIFVGVEYVPLVFAQRTSLVSVLATPRVQPDPEPYARPGTSMIIIG